MNTRLTIKQGNKTYDVICEQVLWLEGGYKMYFNHITIKCTGKIVNAHSTNYDQKIEDGLKYTIVKM